MAPLVHRDTAERARAEAGLNRLDWERFIIITREETRRLVEKYKDKSWAQMPAYERNAAWVQINQSLREEHIPEVGADIISWRMTHAVINMRQTAARATAQAGTVNPSSADADVQDREKRSPIEANFLSQDTPRPSRPFDPIRDI